MRTGVIGNILPGTIVAAVCVVLAWNFTAGDPAAATTTSRLVIPETYSDSMTATRPYVECRIPIRNVGQLVETLKIDKLSCGCVKATLTATELHPGETGYVALLIESPFSKHAEPQWLSDVVRATQISVSASNARAVEPVTYVVSVTLNIRSSIRIGEGHSIVLDVDRAKAREDIVVPVSLEPPVRVLRVTCNDPEFARTIKTQFTETEDGHHAVRFHSADDVASIWPRRDSHLLFELQTNESIFVERIPLRFTKTSLAKANPIAIVINKRNAKHKVHELEFSSSNIIRSITPLQAPTPKNAEITVLPGPSLNRCTVHVEPLSPGIVNHSLAFKILVEEENGVTSEETIRVPVVGNL